MNATCPICRMEFTKLYKSQRFCDEGCMWFHMRGEDIDKVDYNFEYRYRMRYKAEVIKD